MRPAILALMLMSACAPATAPSGAPSPPTQGPGSPQAPALVLPERLRAVGTEPFWAASLVRTTLNYMTPEDQQGTRIELRRDESGGKAAFTGVLARRAVRLVITLAPCSDGMSDTDYPYAVELDLGSERRQGCARPD